MTQIKVFVAETLPVIEYFILNAKIRIKRRIFLTSVLFY